MLAFNSLIAQLNLVEIPLTGRKFTWSSKRPTPSFSRLDRAFLSHSWLSLQLSFTLADLPATTSDHAPLLLTISTLTRRPKRIFKFETFWLNYPEVFTIVQQAWQEASLSPDCVQGLLQKFKSVKIALSAWSTSRFAKMDTFLRRTKIIIRLLDLIEEVRTLSSDEFNLRILLREHAFLLAKSQEQKWRQRSRVTWLRLGDKNTTYFHAVANSRRIFNNIHSLNLPDRVISDQGEIKDAFNLHFRSVLGTPPPHPPPFDLSGLVGPPVDLTSLGTPLTESEIYSAITGLPNNKASGPDGFPIEFYKAFWEIIKSDILLAYEALQNGTLPLQRLNKAYISLVPKVSQPSSLTDYRPISVINCFIKIFTKAMANILQDFIPQLVSPLQTAFTKGRSIMESFLVARECLSFFHKKKNPCKRGFPPLWIASLLRLLRSSSSSIKINGEFTEYFFHKRGLRQGDPLSPLLFIIVADVLQSFITNAAPLNLGPIIIPPRALQYADDTVIIMEAIPRNLLIIKEILTNFASLTGLHINDSKCSFVSIAIPPAAVQTVQQALDCQPKELPITYLGLPLSFHPLRKIHFKPLIDAVQRKLDGWQAKFLSLGGRLTLVRSVLTAMPLHFMQAIRLPAWLLKHLEGLRRSFFWKGKSKCLGGHCLVAWSKCCLPKENGGLGIFSLDLQNQALLSKWLWKLTTQQNSLWTSTISDLFGTTNLQLLSAHELISIGLRDILRNMDFFSASVTIATDQSLTWRWTSQGTYTANSAYKVLADTGVRCLYQARLWKTKVPPKIKIFLWLLLQDRLLTQENLILRGWPTIQSCTTCRSLVMETSIHLFIQCPFAHRLWDLIQDHYNLPVLLFTSNLLDFWLQNRTIIGTQWDIIWAAVCWGLWKERNARIFSSESSNLFILLREIVSTVEFWKHLA
ncbi:hypothetical protein LUZ61_020352 [Rhynchospora tenuis]|uniref:Reverse transcriptase domain-containing protein n=1 Tax=Rhynchospora tenuis TaxID=198213 RepID=A0AAD6ENR6_9POAL|nr:hypothetical protein LUZ61_020352 [Rhynchospora tenuis]